MEGSLPHQWDPSAAHYTELCGRSGHRSRLGFAPRIPRSEPKPRPADGVAGVRSHCYTSRVVSTAKSKVFDLSDGEILALLANSQGALIKHKKCPGSPCSSAIFFEVTSGTNVHDEASQVSTVFFKKKCENRCSNSGFGLELNKKGRDIMGCGHKKPRPTTVSGGFTFKSTRTFHSYISNSKRFLCKMMVHAHWLFLFHQRHLDKATSHSFSLT